MTLAWLHAFRVKLSKRIRILSLLNCVSIIATCPGGKVRVTCLNTCPATCETPNPPLCTSLVCNAGCECPSGTLLHDGRCITQDQCPSSELEWGGRTNEEFNNNLLFVYLFICSLPPSECYLCYGCIWRASVASETLTGVTQSKIGDVCLFIYLFICIYVWTYVCHFVL